MMPNSEHTPVMLSEVLQWWCSHPDGIYCDATYGRGGHSRNLLKCLGSQGRLWAVDRDPVAVTDANQLALQDDRVSVYNCCFSQLEPLPEPGWHGVLMDLGVSSPQLETAERGFSFNRDGPLDMRMNPNVGEPVSVWLSRATEDEIVRVLKEYGEERYARRIARKLVDLRVREPVDTTYKLAELVRSCVPAVGRIDSATRTFMALRILINDEISELQQGLEVALRGLREGGRLLVISFHSLEDRLVKRFIRHHDGGEGVNRRLPPPQPHTRQLRTLGRFRADPQECKDNPRARSGVLRVAEKVVA